MGTTKAHWAKNGDFRPIIKGIFNGISSRFLLSLHRILPIFLEMKLTSVLHRRGNQLSFFD